MFECEASGVEVVAQGPGGERVPLTPAALRKLEALVNRLENALEPAREAAQSRQLANDREAPTRVPDPELHLITSRLARLRRVLDHAEVVRSVGTVVVGRRVVVRSAEDVQETYDVVATGEGDRRAGRISCDSPLGTAVLHRRVGDVVVVSAPLGPLTLTIADVYDASFSDAGAEPA